MVSDPAAIRQVLKDQAACCKSAIERRVLASRVPRGLVTVDGEHWHRLRRLLAPLFGRKMTPGFGPAMAGALPLSSSVSKAARRQRLGDQERDESRCARRSCRLHLFRWARCPQAIRTATIRYYETSSGMDPFDVIGLPDFVPRLTRLGVRSAAKAFDEALTVAITQRRTRMPARHARRHAGRNAASK